MDYLLQILIKSSKCLTVLLFAFFINDPNYKKKVGKSSLAFGLVIFAGLIIFNLSVRHVVKFELTAAGFAQGKARGYLDLSDLGWSFSYL
jgi:hypothetical protein